MLGEHLFSNKESNGGVKNIPINKKTMVDSDSSNIFLIASAGTLSPRRDSHSGTMVSGLLNFAL